MNDLTHELSADDDSLLAMFVDRAHQRHENTYLTRSGRRVAAVVPLPVAAIGLAVMDALEDLADITEAEAALSEPGEPIPLEQVKFECGL